MRRRVAIAGFLHESNTFLGVPTTFDNFLAASHTSGAALLRRWRGALHELGGMVDTIEAADDCDIVPLIATFAIPSGTITSEAFNRIVNDLCDSLHNAGPIDGLLLALHGATVSEQHPDADGEVLARIRNLAGPNLPIVTTLDLHANVSPRMLQLSTATVAYRSNPHLDQRDRGIEAATLLLGTLRGEIHPIQHGVHPPMLIQISKQHTASGPAHKLYSAIDEVKSWPGTLSASIAMGFYYADVAEMGSSVWAVADGDPALAARASSFLAERMWNLRHALTGSLPDPIEAVRHALTATHKPIVLMDIGDNIGAGSPANSTILIDEVLRQHGRNALVILYDPQAAERCAATGIGGTIFLDALRVNATIRVLSDGKFVEREIRHGGWGQYDQGLTALVETEHDHTIILTSRRMAPMSLEQILSLGVNPRAKQLIIVKGVVAPRAAYEPIAAEILLVDTPGVTSDNPRHFAYQHRRVPLFPLEPETEFHP